MNYFIADLHFGHENILSFDNRPFKNITEHDSQIIRNWNQTVGIEDDVYILGDISWYNSTKTIEIFSILNGNKHLIVGNHDNKLLKNQELRKCFVEITDYKELYINKDISIVLSHYPILCFKNHYYGWYHFYGHVHISFEDNMVNSFKRQMIELYDKPCNAVNIGCMKSYMNYTPRTFEELSSLAKEVE